MPDTSQPELLFVYNADGGFLSAIADVARKIFPAGKQTCNLCALTYSPLGMRGEWKLFIESLDRPARFLHRDEFVDRFGRRDIALPALIRERGDGLEVLADARAVNACGSITDLKELVRAALARA